MKRFLLILIFFANLVNAQSGKEEVLRSINSKILVNLSKIPVGSEKLYGFDSREDFQNCTLGNPIQMVSLTADNTLLMQDQWRIPVKLNGNNKTLFTVQKINGNYEIVDIGGAGLSNELQSIENKNITVNYFLRLYTQKIDLVSDAKSLNNSAQMRFIPLESAQLFSNDKQKKRITSALTLNELINLIR